MLGFGDVKLVAGSAIPAPSSLWTAPRGGSLVDREVPVTFSAPATIPTLPHSPQGGRQVVERDSRRSLPEVARLHGQCCARFLVLGGGEFANDIDSAIHGYATRLYGVHGRSA